MGRNTVYGVKQLAEMAGVSTATVSRVLNNHPGVSEKARARILNLMKENQSPTRALDRPAHVLVVVGAKIESYLTEIMAGIASYTHQHRATAEFVSDPKTRVDLDFLRFVRERRCDGLLDLCMGTKPEELVELSQAGLPIMFIGEKINLPNSGYVMIDSFKGSCEIVHYLVALGHQEIFFLANGNDQESDLFLRRQGYLKGMELENLPIHKRRIIEHIPNSDTQMSGYYQTQQLLEASPEATAIIASTDEMAYGAMRACREKGLSVPEDISVVGFDDYRHSDFWNPRLTTMKLPLETFGYKAMHHLDMFINGVSKQLPKVVETGQLIVRDSCTSPR